MIDRLGRNITYLRISVTDKCNLRCRYCMPEDGVCKKDHADMLTEDEIIQMNFPQEYRASETADLFMAVIMYRLKKNGRAAVILPDGFLFGTDNAKMSIKKKLFSEFNLHTVIRMPHSVFAPYTSITTNILFFDRTKPTEFRRF